MRTYNLVPHAPITEATQQIRFNLSDASTQRLLDFHDGHISSIALNGTPIPGEIQNGHIILPAAALLKGPDLVETKFTANIAPAGKAITRFEDHDDGAEYIYSLFVPVDASQAFPCLDQPDLKARFDFDITAPDNWTVVSNTRIEHAEPAKPGFRRTDFAETRPLPTYLFAFAAGPFRMIPGEGFRQRLRCASRNSIAPARKRPKSWHHARRAFAIWPSISITRSRSVSTTWY